MLAKSFGGFVLVCAVVLFTVGAAPSKDLLKRVCKGDKIHLTQSAIKDLLAEMQLSSGGEPKCSPEARDSIVALDKVLSDEAGEICSTTKAELITDYFGKYVLDKKHRAPAAVGLLYTSYGLKVSKVCRQRMVSSIPEATNLLSSDQLEEFNVWTNETSFIAALLPEPEQYDDLVLPKQLAKFLQTKPEKLYLQISTGEKVRHFQALCERRLKPIYEQLILPLLDLANIGFNYRDSHSMDNPSGASDVDNNNKLVYRWYRAVFLCESLANMVILNDSIPDQTDATDRNILRIVPQKEVTDSERGQLERQQLANNYPEIEQLKYSSAHASSPVSEPIVDQEDEDLNQAIKKFKRSRKASTRFISKMFGQFKEKLARGALKLVSHYEIPDTNQMIKFMEDYENNISRAGSSAVASGSKSYTAVKIGLSLLAIAVGCGIIYAVIVAPASGSPNVVPIPWKGR